IVDGFVCTEFARAGEFLVAGRRDPDACADLFRDLERGKRDTTSDSLDEDLLVGSELRTGNEHAPRGERCEREGGGFGNRRVARNVCNVALGHDYILGDRARSVLAEQAKVNAEGLLAVAAVLAGSVTEAGVDDHEIICSIDDS